MRTLTVIGLVGCFALGVAAERHRSGDELQRLAYEVHLLSSNVELLLLHCKMLEQEAAQLNARTKLFDSDL